MGNERTQQYLLQLIASMLNGWPIQEKPEEVTFEELYALSKKHCVENIVYEAIEQLKEQPDSDILKQWENKKDMNILVLVNQLKELEYLSMQFERLKIAHIPLKGPILTQYYPKPDYRYMGDLDIIVKKEDFQRTVDWLQNQGYQPKDFDLAIYHQEFIKPHGLFDMRVEIHEDIMPSYSPYYPIMKDYWDFSTVVEGTTYRYEMPVDEFYMHILTHLAKHYYEEGTGIRSIMDIYIIQKELKDQLNQDYLKEKLEQVGLWKFKTDVERLANAWFQNQKVDKDLEEMAMYFIECGAFGSYENQVKNRIEQGQEEGSKIKYVWKRIFHDPIRMQARYPVLKKHGYLLPVFWVYRIIESIANPKLRKMVSEEMTQLKNFK